MGQRINKNDEEVSPCLRSVGKALRRAHEQTDQPRLELAHCLRRTLFRSRKKQFRRIVQNNVRNGRGRSTSPPMAMGTLISTRSSRWICRCNGIHQQRWPISISTPYPQTMGRSLYRSSTTKYPLPASDFPPPPPNEFSSTHLKSHLRRHG